MPFHAHTANHSAGPFDESGQAWRHLADHRQHEEDTDLARRYLANNGRSDNGGEYSNVWKTLDRIASGNPHEDWPTNADGSGEVSGETPDSVYRVTATTQTQHIPQSGDLQFRLQSEPGRILTLEQVAELIQENPPGDEYWGAEGHLCRDMGTLGDLEVLVPGLDWQTVGVTTSNVLDDQGAVEESVYNIGTNGAPGRLLGYDDTNGTPGLLLGSDGEPLEFVVTASRPQGRA
uniref:hypothetical protein n=1 Tax=Nonomuraea sp. CA-251285 TaxID=3240002 RepID=UPI003F4939D1